MKRYDLLMANKTIMEYRPMNWRERRAYNRRINHALRYVCPRGETFLAVLQLLGWALGYSIVFGTPVYCVVMFVRWWMCI